MPDELEYIRSAWKTKRALGKPKALEITGADFWSRLPDSNWRPHPYHGCALPTELSRRWFVCAVRTLYIKNGARS